MTNFDNTPQPKMPRIKYIIAIASGKGGVGKSTITAQLAASFAKYYSVGVMDADIYGPSIPHLLNASGKPALNDESYMIPHKHQTLNLVSNSMGYLIGEDTAASWRGPMASKALFQLFFQTAWGELDYLFIDMPPGTGDIQLSLASKIPVSAAILVTTPQALSVLDVKKAADLFRKVRIPIIGLIENMSYFVLPETQEPQFLFGKEGGKTLASDLSIPFLGQIPIEPTLNQSTLLTEPLPLFDKFVRLIEKK